MKTSMLFAPLVACALLGTSVAPAWAQNWSLTGNAGTNPATNFIGTIDNVPLEARVENVRAWRLEPAVPYAGYGPNPNVIGGSPDNFVTAGKGGATIAGGGGKQGTGRNRVLGNFGTVGGGEDSEAGDAATVAGGFRNAALGNVSAVGGGSHNTGSGNGSTVAGGAHNTASGMNSVIAGGSTNTAGGGTSSVAGGQYNAATGDSATVAGGQSNTASGIAAMAAGGQSNTASGIAAMAAGGQSNTASGIAAMAAGGSMNTAQGDLSFAAGQRAKANHRGAFVWADSANADFASTTNDQFNIRASGGARLFRGVVSAPATQAAFQLENGANEGESALLRTHSAANPHGVIKLIKHPEGANNFLECALSEGGREKRKCHIDKNGTWHGGSDFAEALPARGGRAGYEPGDVLVFSDTQPGAVEKASRRYDARLIGVFSTRPAVLGADKDGDTRVDPDDVPVAIVGIVPTKISAENGAVRPGDLLTTGSTPGHAMKATPMKINGVEVYPPGAIIGKAMGSLASGVGVVKVLLTLR